jgi:hypothetical protein
MSSTAAPCQPSKHVRSASPCTRRAVCRLYQIATGWGAQYRHTTLSGGIGRKSLPRVLVGVTPHQGARESHAQGEVAQVAACPEAVRDARCGTPKQDWSWFERGSKEATGKLLEIENSRAVWRGAIGKVPARATRWWPTLRHVRFEGRDTPYLLGQRSLPYSTSRPRMARKFLDSMRSRGAQSGRGRQRPRRYADQQCGLFPFRPTHDTTEDVFDRVYALPPTLGTIMCGQTTALDI